MTDSRMFRAIAFGSLFLLLPVFGACLDQDSVYGDDRPEGTDPPTASNRPDGMRELPRTAAGDVERHEALACVGITAGERTRTGILRGVSYGVRAW